MRMLVLGLFAFLGGEVTKYVPTVRTEAQQMIGGFLAAPAGDVCAVASGDCCAPHGGLGCGDASCCNAVCLQDPYCCEVIWDKVCVGHAVTHCPTLCGEPLCPPGAVGDCCAAHATPGCADEDCCNTVCQIDPLCCSETWEWDIECVAIAEEHATECRCGVSPEACCQVDGGCTDLFEDECVASGGIPLGEGTACLLDGNSNGIDDACESSCPAGADGDCCNSAANETPGCDDPECCRLVCLADSLCCAEVWDSICANYAQDLCPVCNPSICPPDAEGDCCTANGTPGCNNPICCEEVCFDDHVCCEENGWDEICAQAAQDLCAPLCDCLSFGDVDGSGTWNYVDFALFQACLTGPLNTYAGLDCICTDQAGDGHAALNDMAAFMNLFSAP